MTFPTPPEAYTDPALERTALMLCCAFADSQIPLLLEPDDFVDQDYREIFYAIQVLREDRGDCSFPALATYLSPHDWYDKKGGSAFLAKLMLIGWPDTYWPAPDEHVARALRELRIRRKAKEFSISIGEARAMIDQFSAHAERMAKLLPNAEQSTLDVLDAITEAPQPWIPTGFPSLDAFVNMRRGNLVCVGARTGFGKTAFLCNIACNNARAGRRVAYLTKEMTTAEIVPRFLKYLTQKTDLAAAKQAVDRTVLEKITVHRVRTVEDVERVSSLVEADLIIVDYIQLLEVGGRRMENRVNELERVTNKLKGVAMDAGKCLLCASQISRETDRTGDEPVLADLKGSGSIEQDSNVVILLHNPSILPKADQGDRNSRRSATATVASLEGEKGIATIIIAKNRSGKCGKIKLKWADDTVTFSEVTGTPRFPARP